MKRILAIALSFVLMITAFTLPASAAEKPFLPDPGVYVDAQGQAYDSGTSDGESYVIYAYAAYQTLDNMNAFVNAYANDLAKLSYTTVPLDSEDAAYYAQYQHTTGPAAELMILFNDDQSKLNAGEACEWILLVYVPDTLDFQLGVAARDNQGSQGGQGGQEGQGTQGGQGSQGGQGGHEHDGLTCIPCGGSGCCLVCGGAGEATFGPVTGTCVVCMGTGVCGLCRGSGSFTN